MSTKNKRTPDDTLCSVVKWHSAHAYESPGDFRGAQIRGRSISTLADDRSIAIVDISQRDPDKLVDQPVIVESDGEVTAKVYRRNPERFELYSDDPGFATTDAKSERKILGRIVDSVRRMPRVIR